MNYQQSLDYLYSLQKSGIKLGLKNTIQLLELLGNPHEKFYSIHIAGTNGKGSTSSFIASILTAMNFRVGLYTSPHLVRFNERIKLDGKEIEDDFLVEMVRFLYPRIEEMKPTFFEVTTAIAFRYFSEMKVDYAVIETGLGGRFDSTNVLLPEVSVITKIGMDHKEFLGDTIEKIALEKAGIIKEKIPVVISSNEDIVEKIFQRVAEEKNSSIIFVNEKYSHKDLNQSLDALNSKVYSKITSKEYAIYSPLIGEYQIENIKTSVAAVETLFPEKNLEQIIYEGIKNLKFKLRGRFEVLKTEPMIILDTSHNSDAIQSFLSSLNKMLPNNKVAVFGIMKDKEIDDVIELIDYSFERIYLCQTKTERSMNVEDLAIKFDQSKIAKFNSVELALRKALSEAQNDQTIVVFGSNYVVGEAIEFIEKKNEKMS